MIYKKGTFMWVVTEDAPGVFIRRKVRLLHDWNDLDTGPVSLGVDLANYAKAIISENDWRAMFYSLHPTESFTVPDAEAEGYKVVRAGPFEVGLLWHGQPLRTFWDNEFTCELPPLDHPVIQEAITTHRIFRLRMTGR